MATLVLKLGTALLKQVSKPAAKALTNYVLERPSLRQYVVRMARDVHKFNVRLAHFGENKVVRVGEMVEDKAVELAANMMTETFIYSFAAATVYWEWTRSAEASEKKKQAEKELTAQLRAEAAAQRQLLLDQNSAQETAIQELKDRIEALEAQRRSWWRGVNKGSAAQHLAPPVRHVSASNDSGATAR